MKNISDIDPNFKVETSLGKEDIRFYDVRTAPFRVYGLMDDGKQFRRMPREVAEQVSEGVLQLHSMTAGGRVRFCSDSPYIAIHAVMPTMSHMVHFPFTGSVGFDLYVKVDGKDRYVRTFIPPIKECEMYENVIDLDATIEAGVMHEFTIHFPLYSDVSALYIGLSETAKLAEAPDYRHEKPIVYYGSSITQGGCTSRPGNAYQNIITRRLSANHINLGFSGNAKGEDPMIDYLASLDMSLFVLDYDYNAPTAEHLQNTHERLFKAVRKTHPNIPIVMLTRPKCFLTQEEVDRREIVRTTYQNALDAGDKNVYFLSGEELMSMTDNEGTVDSCHPNDLGFFSMATVLGNLLETLV